MDFQEWLLDELRQRHWSQSELSRRAKVSRAAISNILSKTRKPGIDVCEAIAVAFHIPHEEVYRRAGLLPGRTTRDTRIKEIENIYDQLDDGGKIEMLEQARLRFRIQEERGRYDPRTKPHPKPT